VILRIFLNDFRPRDVARHQVGRELDSLEGQVQRLGKRADEQRFGQAGDTFQQCVAAGEHRHQHLLDDFALPDDDFGKFIAEAVIGFLTPLHCGNVVLLFNIGHGSFGSGGQESG
jgi:hypothetical protein